MRILPGLEVKQKTLLFFDDESLTARENIVRKQGVAKRIDGSSFHDPNGNATWGYPAVFRAPEEDAWLCIYGVAYLKGRGLGGGCVGLARSEDGIHWQPDERAASVEIPDRRSPNQIVSIPAEPIHGLFSSAFELATPVEGFQKYNILFENSSKGVGQIWTSSDCLNWTLTEGANWQSPAPDPPTFVHWNTVRKSYVLTTRPESCDRRIAVFGTRDFRNYTAMELALHADSLDRPYSQIYGMPVFPYHGWYIGLPWMFDISATDKAGLPHKYLGGKQNTQLAYSRNGWHWQRSFRDALIPNGEPGEPDGGCLQTSHMLEWPDGTLRFYASTSLHEHGHCPDDDGYITAYSLRKDGFVYLESDGGKGIVGTRALYWKGGEALLNVQSPAGWIRVQITEPNGTPIEGYRYEESEVFRGDSTEWTPSWKEGKCLSALAGKMIRMEIEIENGRLYAVRGDLIECRLIDVHRWNSGIIPEDNKL